MTIKFDRPVGTPADLKELEYISALHQTCFPLRRDGSIDATDIVNYLSSRHGIIVSQEIVKQHILVELSGELEVEPAYKMDLVEVVALLLIPYLLSSDSTRAIAQVLEVMLNQTAGSKINGDFLKTLLDFHGEVEVSDDVLNDMMEAVGGEGTVLNAESLRYAVTSDVMRYKVDWEKRLTTHYEDVFSEPPSSDELVDHKQTVKDNTDEEDPSKMLPFKTVWTAPAIDFVADTYRSQTFSVLLWVCMVVVYLAYFWNFELKWGEVDCSRIPTSDFACAIINGITRWLVIFVELSVLGTAFIFFGSAGNSLFVNKPLAFVRLLVGIATIALSTIVSVFVTVESPVVSTAKNEEFNAVYWTAFVLGCVLLCLQVLSMVRLFFSLHCLKKFKPLEVLLTPGIEKMERRTKTAAQGKVARIVENALAFHQDSSEESPLSTSRHMTALGKALLNFQIRPEETETVGGLLWSWKRVWDRSIFEDEGVWLHSRLVACSLAQLFICILLIVLWTIMLRVALDEVKGSSGSWESAVVSELVYVWEVVVGATAGIFAGLAATFGITMIYIPSFISTVLKFRSGVIGSLRERDFIIYRYAAEQVTVLFGSAVWGCLFTGVAALVLIGGLVFLAVWNVTRPVVITVIAQLIGVGVTVLLRMLILMFLRTHYCAAFYRIQTWKDNFMNTVLECWNIGISSGFMLIRACQLFFLTACYLGRLDAPLLAPGVGVVNNIALDSYPNAFRKDILSHDAHRHPYIERLGTMYMMKLRCGQDFGKRSGSCWRVLFVLCLMPWMRKYRLRSILFIEGLSEEIKQAETDLEEEEQNSQAERTLQHVETRRKLDRMKNLRDLTHFDGVTSREQLLEREIALLRERNQQLLADNKQLHWMVTGNTNTGYHVGMNLQKSSTEQAESEGTEVVQ